MPSWSVDVNTLLQSMIEVESNCTLASYYVQLEIKIYPSLQHVLVYLKGHILFLSHQMRAHEAEITFNKKK